jgi:hypothetical protein
MRFGGFLLGKTTRHTSDAKLETNKGLGLTKTVEQISYSSRIGQESP